MGDGQVAQPAAIRQRLHDPNIMIEEYLYYAKIQREQERRGLDPAQRTALQMAGLVNSSGKSSSDGQPVEDEKREISDEKTPQSSNSIGHKIVHPSSTVITPAEWENASRASRNATWGAM